MIEKLTVTGKTTYVVNRFHLAQYAKQAKRGGVSVDKDFVSFEKNEVFSFTDENIKKFMEESGLDVVKSCKSNVKNVMWVWFRKKVELPPAVERYFAETDDPIEAYPIVYPIQVKDKEKFHTNGKEGVFAYIAQRVLGPALKREMLLSVPHGETQKYRADGSFQIYIWSSPTSCRKMFVPPKTIWGVPVSCRDNAFQPPEPTGIDKERKFICDGLYKVAEFLPNAVYIHHDMVHHGDEEEFLLFAMILAKVRGFIMDPEAYVKYVEKMRKAGAEAEKNAFANLVKSAVSKRAGRDKITRHAAERKAQELATAYFAAERAVFAARQTEIDQSVSEKRFLEEFEKLQTGGVKLVERLFFDVQNNETILLHTEEIVVEHPRKRGVHHLIGRCEIELQFNTGKLLIRNLDRTFIIDGTVCHTPHVFYEDGHNVCLGSINEEVRAYIAHFEIEAVAVLVIAFLQSCANEDSYLRRLEKFPVIKHARVA